MGATHAVRKFCKEIQQMPHCPYGVVGRCTLNCSGNGALRATPFDGRVCPRYMVRPVVFFAAGQCCCVPGGLAGIGIVGRVEKGI